MKITKIILVVVVLLVVSCSKTSQPLAPVENQGKGFLDIQTSSQSYTWQQGQDRKSLHIDGELVNKSNSVFFSSLGDWEKSAYHNDLLLFSGNSAGSIEKYNVQDKTWDQVDLQMLLIEGSHMVAIDPQKQYSINASLSLDGNQTESGTYRLRVDYSLTDIISDGSEILHDYSNEFVIK